MRKSVGKCQTYPKFGQFYPQFETFLPLQSLSCQFYVAKKPFKIKEFALLVFDGFLIKEVTG